MAGKNRIGKENGLRCFNARFRGGEKGGPAWRKWPGRTEREKKTVSGVSPETVFRESSPRILRKTLIKALPRSERAR